MTTLAPEQATRPTADRPVLCTRLRLNDGPRLCPEGTRAVARLVVRCDGHTVTSGLCQVCADRVLTTHPTPGVLGAALMRLTRTPRRWVRCFHCKTPRTREDMTVEAL